MFRSLVLHLGAGTSWDTKREEKSAACLGHERPLEGAVLPVSRQRLLQFLEGLQLIVLLTP